MDNQDKLATRYNDEDKQNKNTTLHKQTQKDMTSSTNNWR